MTKIDPICGMNGKISAHEHWFCSEYCLRKYEAENSLACIQMPAQKHGLSLRSLLTTIIKTLLIVALLVPGMEIFRHHFLKYSGMIWLPLIAGFLIGGIIEVYIPRTYIIKILGGNEKKAILYGAFLGFLFSGCSHGCLAIAIELFRKGAAVPSIIAFLVASPWANISFTLLILTFFGLKGTLLLLSSFLIALFTAWSYTALERKNWIEKNPNAVEIKKDFSIFSDLKNRWNEYHFKLSSFLLEEIPKVAAGSWHLAQMVLWWILLGVSLASLVSAFVPVEIFQKWMGKNLSGMAVTLGFATVIEICSEGSAPLAFEIYQQTQAMGNAFIFLMAGVITDYTEIGLLWSNIGKRTALWLPVIAVPPTLFLGFLFNFFL